MQAAVQRKGERQGASISSALVAGVPKPLPHIRGMAACILTQGQPHQLTARLTDPRLGRPLLLREPSLAVNRVRT